MPDILCSLFSISGGYNYRIDINYTTNVTTAKGITKRLANFFAQSFASVTLNYIYLAFY